MAAQTNYEWEDAFIAPVTVSLTIFIITGRRLQSGRFLDYVAVPTLIVNSEDDPQCVSD